ncbi:MAG: 6-phosphogluconolactonase [Phycisphaerae bacterium]
MIRIFHEYEELCRTAAEYIVTIGKRCIGKQGTFDLVLSGGKTPAECYRILAGRHQHEQKLWSNTHVYWSDERCVPPTDPESNYYMAKTTLLDFVNIPPEQIHRIPGESPDPQAAANQYDAKFPLSVDLLLLGIGQEGHTASIFPFSPVITETKRHVVYVEAPVKPQKRITITPLVIANAVEVLVLVSGENKAHAMEQVFTEFGNVQETPARLIRKAVWFVDKPAAKRIAKHISVVQSMISR